MLAVRLINASDTSTLACRGCPLAKAARLCPALRFALLILASYRARFLSSGNGLKTAVGKETGGDLCLRPELFISAEGQRKAPLPRPADVVASIAGACWSSRQTSSAGQDSRPRESVRSTICEFPSSWRGDPVAPLTYRSAGLPSAIVLTSECR